MGKTVYLIVSDLHLYFKNLSSRIDYVEEMKDIRGEIIRIAIKYVKAGYDSVNLLLLGDVFHRSYSKIEPAQYDNNFFALWREKFGKCYSVMGNHELTYSKDNPFFSLVSQIDSLKLQSVKNKVWTPKGLLPIIQVVDELTDGDVTFYFNHYGCPVSKPGGEGVHIGLFHQDIVSNEIVKVMEQRLGTSIYASTLDFSNYHELDGYDYCFFGHMHKVYGTWRTGDGMVLCYLASLGRTNIGEVSDSFLERNIPAVRIEDGKFISVDDNFVKLPSYVEVIDDVVAQEKSEQYKQVKAKKLARSYDPLADDPVQSLFRYFLESEYKTKIIRGLLENEIDPIGQALSTKYNYKFGGRNDY